MKINKSIMVYYNQIFQEVSIKMAFVKKVSDDLLEQMFYQCDCRDFLSDVLINEEQKVKPRIYNFNYDGTTSQIDRDKLRLVLYPQDKEIGENIITHLGFLHEIEQKNELTKSEFMYIDNECIYVVADPFWLSSTFSLNFFTYMIKCLGHNLKGSDWIKKLPRKETNEGNYMDKMQDNFLVVMDNLKEILSFKDTVHGYTIPMGSVDLHDNCGIYTLCKEDAKNIGYITSNKYYQMLMEVKERG